MATRPIWRCYECGGALRGDDGMVYIPDQEIAEALGDAGIQLRWRIAHDRCASDVASYSISSRMVMEWQGVALRTAHLMEKRWFAATNWGALIYAANRP